MHKRIITHNNECLYVSLTEIDNTFKTNMHSHPNIEILLIIKGNGFIHTNSKEISVKERDIVIVNPNSKHFEYGNGLTFYAIGLNNINIYLKETFNKKIIHYSLPNNDFLSLTSLYNLIYKESSNSLLYSNEIISSCISSIINIIKRNKEILISDSKESIDSDLVTNIKNIIDNYYYQNIKLDEIAHRLNESKSNICHIFKKETGMSIIGYKLNKQLEEANNLLLITDMNITQISSMVGFNSASSFSKYYKEKYGFTPKSTKKQNNSI